MGVLASLASAHEQAADFKCKQPGVEIVGRCLRAERDKVAVHLDQCGTVSRVLRRARAICRDCLSQLHHRCQTISIGAGSDEPRKVRAGRYLHICPVEKVRHLIGDRCKILLDIAQATP